VRSGFDDLREHFSQDDLLGKVLGAYHDATALPYAAWERQEEQCR
jgi:hypothetical protein